MPWHVSGQYADERCDAAIWEAGGGLRLFLDDDREVGDGGWD